MKQLKIIALSFLMLLSTSCMDWAGERIKGNGEVITITRTTSNYNGLKAAGSMNFELVPGNEGTITIKGDSNLMEYIVTEIKNDNLIVKVKSGYNLSPSKAILVTVPYETIDNVSLAGSGDIINTGTINSENLNIALAGSGDIKLNVESQSVTSSIAGSGDIDLMGITKDLSTNIAGSGDFKGNELVSTNVDVNIAGSGSTDVVCNGDLKVRISGSGNVRYSGNPTSKDTKVSGSGSIKSN